MPKKHKVSQRKIKTFITGIVLIFLILLVRLSSLQIFEAEHFRTLARENTLRLIPISAPRGEIFDRENRKIVGNRPVYMVQLINVGQTEDQLAPVISLLSRILDKPVAEIKDKIREGKFRPYEPVVIAKDVPLDVITRIEEHRAELPGVTIDIEPRRKYPYGKLLAHTLGYIQEINPEQLEQHRDEGYRLGDTYGQAGLENVYEKELRGEKGARQVEVDAYANPVRTLGVKEPVPGNNLHLTIDLDVQKAVEEALEKTIKTLQEGEHKQARAGAVVVEDVRSGAILAIASYPAYNPGMFTGRLTTGEVQKVLLSPDRPFINRAIQSTYPPGSTFKMVTAAAALEQDLDPTYRINCKGYYWWDRLYTDWTYPRGHGSLDVIEAIQKSCDVYFWIVGRMIGYESIARMATEFGLGQKTGIDLPGEAKGVVPNVEYKRMMIQKRLDQLTQQLNNIKEKYERLMKEATSPEEKESLEKKRQRELNSVQEEYERLEWELQWHDYDTLNMSIGQGYNLYTPLQIANYVSAVANGGMLYRPYLVEKITSPEGEVLKEFKPEPIRRVDISRDTIQFLQEGMRQVTRPGGTAYWVFHDFPVETAGKTGTAEIYGKDNHGWYVAYAPAEDPEVAVACIVEHGGHGSSAAAPVVKAALSAYFDLPVESETVAPTTE
ncbi:MAG: penicillin-binding protein 2 [Peptococcaceae bacterium]|nr:penicillin-binding protein 2 [Peptococcaceae bacterium]